MNLKLQDRQVFSVLSIVRDDSEMIEVGRLKVCLLAETRFFWGLRISTQKSSLCAILLLVTMKLWRREGLLSIVGCGFSHSCLEKDFLILSMDPHN